MSDDLSQLDALIESDVLEALGQSVPKDETKVEEPIDTDDVNVDDINSVVDTNNTDVLLDQNEDNSIEDIEDIGDIEILPLAEIESALDEQEEEVVSMDSSDLGSLANILSKLLNNKTIEITIKVKD